MKMKMSKILFTVAVTTIVGTAQAASYQAQGCGLGSTIWTDGSSMVDQVLGATTNGTSGNQTFGITSGTSNCELDGGGTASVTFIEANKVALSNDIARGNGATLASLVKMYGCNDVEMAGSVLQKNYEMIFTSTASAQMIDNQISNVIASNKACM